jgi:hypothetical protein
MITDVAVHEEVTSLEELDLWFQREGWKAGYGTKLFLAPQWRSEAYIIALQDGVNEYEAFRRWFVMQPVRF